MRSIGQAQCARFWLLGVGFSLLFGWGAVAEAAAGTEDQPVADPLPPELREAIDQRRPSFALLPGAFSTKETSIGFALFGAASWFSDGALSAKTSRSQASLALAYTLKKQLIIQYRSQIFMDDDRWVLWQNYDYRIFPNRYYGIGNEAPALYQDFKENRIDFYTELRRRLVGRLYLGLAHNARGQLALSSGALKNEAGDELDLPPFFDESVEGFESGFSHGVGLSLVCDWRDDPIHPLSGGYYYTSVVLFQRIFGGDYNFTRWILDLRQAIPVWPQQHHVLMLRVLHELRLGTTPFHQMAELGGPFQMRGFYQGRFRDCNLLVFQVEYRADIWWRIGAVAFASLGQVYGESNFSLSKSQWVVGPGLRFRFGKDIYIRLDAGFGPGTTAIIFNSGHAF